MHKFFSTEGHLNNHIEPIIISVVKNLLPNDKWDNPNGKFNEIIGDFIYDQSSEGFIW